MNLDGAVGDRRDAKAPSGRWFEKIQPHTVGRPASAQLAEHFPGFLCRFCALAVHLLFFQMNDCRVGTQERSERQLLQAANLPRFRPQNLLGK